MSQVEADDDDDSGGERPLYIKEEEDEDQPIKEEDVSSDGNDTRLSDLHNTTLKTEDDSEEDKPLVDNIFIKYIILVFKNKIRELSFECNYMLFDETVVKVKSITKHEEED